MKEVKKKWGKEVWVVNSDKYCGKLLYLDKGARSSLHCHREKQETFWCLEGKIDLRVGDHHYAMPVAYHEPVTIPPHAYHSFYGIEDATILEVSTHHKESDVVRLTKSRSADE